MLPPSARRQTHLHAKGTWRRSQVGLAAQGRVFAAAAKIVQVGAADARSRHAGHRHFAYCACRSARTASETFTSAHQHAPVFAPQVNVDPQASHVDAVPWLCERDAGTREGVSTMAKSKSIKAGA